MAQDSTIVISGQILDKQTETPISFVHMVCSVKQTISDSNGIFSIQVQKGDTIKFSHINYERYDIKLSEIPDHPIHIYLTKKETVLPELIIREYLPEEELKNEIINHNVTISIEETNAINNVASSTILYLQGYVPEMNSLDNFKNYIKEPQGVTLFSSDPSKGLIKTIKRLSQQSKTFNQSRLNLNNIKSDTTQTELFLFPKQ